MFSSRLKDLEKAYPIQLLDHSLLPRVPQKSVRRLYAQGNLSLLQNHFSHHRVSIVGTRKASDSSKQWMKTWFSELSHFSLQVVSGFALGIDQTSHELALDHHIPTIAVLASGLHFDYPKTNFTLRKRILESGGLLLSEYPNDTPAYPGHFLDRNRIIACLSEATIMVECGIPSGALNTVQWCLDLGKTPFVVPCFPKDPRRKGNQKLIESNSCELFWGVQSLEAVYPKNQLLSVCHTQKTLTQLQNAVLALETELAHHPNLEELLTYYVRQNYGDEEAFFEALQFELSQSKISQKQGCFIVQNQ